MPATRVAMTSAATQCAFPCACVPMSDRPAGAAERTPERMQARRRRVARPSAHVLVAMHGATIRTAAERRHLVKTDRLSRAYARACLKQIAQLFPPAGGVARHGQRRNIN